MEQPAYRVDAGDAIADRDRILALWRICGFGGSTEENAARYDWFYLRNPQGQGRVYLLRASGSDEILGAVGVGARNFHRGREAQLSPSGTLVDFVVNPAHRSLFPALLLQRTVCEREFQRCGFVYGLPLAKAVPVVARLAGATRFNSDTYVRVVRSAAYIRKKAAWLPSSLATFIGGGIDLLRSIHIWLVLLFSRVQCRHDTRLPDLARGIRRIAETDGVIIGDRSPEILAWRARVPGGSVHTMSFHDENTQDVIGYAMYSVDSSGLVVLDFIVPDDDRQARCVWLELCRRAMSLNAAAVRVEFGGWSRVTSRLRDAGYFHRGSRPGFVILREPAHVAGGKWWFTRLDEDV